MRYFYKFILFFRSLIKCSRFDSESNNNILCLYAYLLSELNMNNEMYREEVKKWQT